MALLDRDAAARNPKHRDPAASPLVRIMREFEQLVLDLETGLQRSLDDPRSAALDGTALRTRQAIRREACRIAVADLSNNYARKHIHRSLHAAEAEGKRVEEQLHSRTLDAHVHAHVHPHTHAHVHAHSHNHSHAHAHAHDELALHNGYFRLYSTELFDLLGQPTDLRLGTLRFHRHDAAHVPGVAVELALNDAFFVANSDETLPYHTFRMPTTPSLQNRGILSRNPADGGAFPDFDSWLLFTFLGNGCLKLEVPVEMCASVYGGRLRGRENEEVTFWGFFVDDDID